MVRLNAVRKFSEATAILIAEQVCVCGHNNIPVWFIYLSWFDILELKFEFKLGQ